MDYSITDLHLQVPLMEDTRESLSEVTITEVEFMRMETDKSDEPVGLHSVTE